MHQIEKVVRTIKGEKKEVEILFGVGYLTSNPPEIKEINGGYKLMSEYGFSLKVPNGRGNASTYYSLEIWGIQAEYMKNLGFEGQQVAVTGRITVSTYNNKEYKTLVVERFTCIDRKSANVTSNETAKVVEEDMQNRAESKNDEAVSVNVEEKAKETYSDLPF